jgi:hypothetical protein
MVRNLAIAGLAATLIGCLPAQAQEVPPLEGGPGSRAAEQDVARQIAAQNKAVADKIKAEQAKLAQQTAAQKAEQARLAKQAEELKAREARLEARAAELAAEEKRLAQLRNGQKSAQTEDLAAREARLEARVAELDAEEQRLAQLREEVRSEQAARLTELIRQGRDTEREEARVDETPPPPLRTADRSIEADRPNIGDGDAEDDLGDDLPDVQPEQGARRPLYARVDFETAERSCSRAAEDEATARNYYSARYDRAPRFYRGYGLELRGPMRLTDRRGSVLLNTVCELDADGEVQHFIFLR